MAEENVKCSVKIETRAQRRACRFLQCMITVSLFGLLAFFIAALCLRSSGRSSSYLSCCFKKTNIADSLHCNKTVWILLFCAFCCGLVWIAGLVLWSLARCEKILKKNVMEVKVDLDFGSNCGDTKLYYSDLFTKCENELNLPDGHGNFIFSISRRKEIVDSKETGIHTLLYNNDSPLNFLSLCPLNNSVNNSLPAKN